MTTQSVRVEFLKLGKGGFGGNPQNVISGLLGAATQALAVTTTATTAGSRPVVPGVAGAPLVPVRLTAVGDLVHAAWGADPTATLTNGLRLVPGVPEVVLMPAASKISFISET